MLALWPRRRDPRKRRPFVGIRRQDCQIALPIQMNPSLIEVGGAAGLTCHNELNRPIFEAIQ
jgi:hypothetical protein